MLILSNTTDSIKLTTSAVGTIDYVVSYADITTTGFTPIGAHGRVNTATTTTSIGAPAASTQRQVKSIIVRNAGSGAQTITVVKDVSGVQYVLFAATLNAGDGAQYYDTQGWSVIDATGRVRTSAATDAGFTGQAAALYKVGTAPEAAGQWYSWAKDTGNPGAWSPGTPGVNGRATDGTSASDAGCVPIKNATTGNNYLTNFTGATSVACNPWLFDVLWVNSGLSVTTTSAQAITPVSLPSRDADGGNSGKGVWMGLLVTTATTQAGAVTTISASYTNSSGVSGRTATVASFPATAVIGTVVWFRLAAGDSGVQSVQSVTLGTTLTAGAISLILARPLWSFPSLVANVGGLNVPPQTPGVRLYPGTCALPIGLMSTTTATTLQATVTVMER